jgi:two-component system cell cycle response regulator
MSARVLVVDDLLPNVKLLEAKLTREYYEVVTAFNGKEAIEKARKLSPDIILLDIMMPEMDGFETCRRLRADPELSHIPIVMVTALSEKEDRIRGLEAGADDFLTKPVADGPLFARVRSLIRLKVMMDELRLRGVTNVKLGMDENELSLGKISDAKILLVDDDGVQSSQLIDKLSHINKNIKLVNKPEAAIEVANKGEFDLAIISTQLADADGLRICSQLRSNEQTRNMSILIVIEEDDNQSMLKGMEIGVNDYIATPVDTNELVARAKTLIRRKKYQDALRSNFKTSISLAVTDGLTGLYNRRFMDTHIEQLVKEAQDYQKPLSVLMMDIDFFKKVNDTHGHNVGDEVIKEFSQRVLRSIRPSDLAVRYGGEEFVVILPGTFKEDAKVVSERLRNNIEKVPFTVSTEEGILAKTVSIGIAGLKPNETAEQILKRADEALYKAKNEGRNQCIVSEG